MQEEERSPTTTQSGAGRRQQAPPLCRCADERTQPWGEEGVRMDLQDAGIVGLYFPGKGIVGLCAP